MRPSYPLFQSHLDLAHHYWAQLLKGGEIVIDATCGNGHDTLKLCQLVLSHDKGAVYAIDNQEIAIANTKQRLTRFLSTKQLERVHFTWGCHTHFPSTLAPKQVSLIVYNLGYLPGGDKQKTTEVSTTSLSLQQALPLIRPGGLISVTCYPGHPEGAREEESILSLAQQLSPLEWSCCHHRWLNRRQAPSLLLLQRNLAESNYSAIA